MHEDLVKVLERLPEGELLYDMEKDGCVVSLFEDPHSAMPLAEAAASNYTEAEEKLVALIRRVTTLLDEEEKAL